MLEELLAYKEGVRETTSKPNEMTCERNTPEELRSKQCCGLYFTFASLCLSLRFTTNNPTDSWVLFAESTETGMPASEEERRPETERPSLMPRNVKAKELEEIQAHRKKVTRYKTQ